MIFALIALLSLPTMSHPTTLLIGSYTPKDGSCLGIQRVHFDAATGQIGAAELVIATPNPTFLGRHPNGRWLYAVSESVNAEGKTGGAAAAFSLTADGSLTALNVAPLGGGGVSHLALDATGRVLVIVSYSGGQIASFPILPDGRIGARQTFIAPTGPKGPHPRQDKSHPHSTTFSPDNRRAYICDLGLDRIYGFSVNPATAALTQFGEYAARPGAGPRHSKFSADGKFFYVINELDSTVATYAVDAASGALALVQAVSTLPAGFTGENICAEVQLHPNGKFLYGSNRGHDSLAVFARDPALGTLSLVEVVASGGKHPRHFALSPDGAALICANRDSNNLVSFKVDGATGRLTPTGHSATAVQAVCVLFLPTW